MAKKRECSCVSIKELELGYEHKRAIEKLLIGIKVSQIERWRDGQKQRKRDGV